jgi:hypothetical protein
VTAPTVAASPAVMPQRRPGPPPEGVVHRPGTDCSQCGAPVRRRHRFECDTCYAGLAAVEDERRAEMRGQAGTYTPTRYATHHDNQHPES